MLIFMLGPASSVVLGALLASTAWPVQCSPVQTGCLLHLRVWRGVPGCVFVHASGFIGGNATYEGVLEMARKIVAA
jgi:hypothetical protein